ncbi:hypothetical protein LWI29_025727 [Acer saccharum]|uniref:CCHC-type domain-containing protein n=1 Tax=Acer saccharum TaxID=4024 RepID=A0AA39W2D6_ACESA|nr:hypothetical protein LWI29_025727 [Acer saccharum]
MPQKYFSLVTVLEELDKVFTLEDLQGTLKAYEAKLNLLNPQPRQPDQALKSEVSSSGGRGSYNNHGRGGNFQGRGGNSRGRGRNFSGNNYSSNNQHESNQNSGNNNNGNNHHGGNQNQNFNSQQRGRGRGFQRGRGRGYFECHFCHKLGHVISDCWHKQAEDKKNDAVLIHENSEETLLLACYGDDIDEVCSNSDLLVALSSNNPHHSSCPKKLNLAVLKPPFLEAVGENSGEYQFWKSERPSLSPQSLEILDVFWTPSLVEIPSVSPHTPESNSNEPPSNQSLSETPKEPSKCHVPAVVDQKNIVYTRRREKQKEVVVPTHTQPVQSSEPEPQIQEINTQVEDNNSSNSSDLDSEQTNGS